MMIDLYETFSAPLTHTKLFKWHKFLVRGEQTLRDVGRYRTDPEPMQIVSGRIDSPTIHFEAPPVHVVKREMDAFIAWFNNSAPGGTWPLPTLAARILIWHHLASSVRLRRPHFV